VFDLHGRFLRAFGAVGSRIGQVAILSLGDRPGSGQIGLLRE